MKVNKRFTVTDNKICFNKEGLVFDILSDAELLELSIAKWKTVVNLLKVTESRVYDGGTDTCALCSKYHESYAIRRSGWKRCDGCPVKNKTGQPGCRGTPYSRFSSVSRQLERREYAIMELRFLTELYLEESLKVGTIPTKKHDVIIVPCHNGWTVWADMGNEEVIKSVPGVHFVICSQPNYYVQLDPRYDKGEVLDAIKEAIRSNK